MAGMGGFGGDGSSSGMGLDPMTMAHMMMFAGQNPQLAGPMFDQMGIPVPQNGVSPASMLGGQPTPTGGNTTPLPGAPGQSPNAQLGQQLQGVKAPAPITPIMSGGVAGGVKPPEVKTGAIGSGAIQMLMQALLGANGQGAPASPALGDYIRGGVKV